MRCICTNCNSPMSHDEKGISSQCICTNCNEKCDLCLGTNSVKSVDEIKEIFEAKK